MVEKFEASLVDIAEIIFRWYPLNGDGNLLTESRARQGGRGLQGGYFVVKYLWKSREEGADGAIP